MHTTEMKHVANLEKWKKRIMACRTSGLTVREWCSRNAWSTLTYYRWEREAFGNLGEQSDQPGNPCTTTAPASGQSLVEIPVAASDRQALAPAEATKMPTKPPRARKSEAHRVSQEETLGFQPVAVLRVGHTELSLTNEVSQKLMRQVKELLSHAE